MDRTAPSMSKPSTVPHRTCRHQKADPTAAILSAALLLDHLGFAQSAARKIEAAVTADVEARDGSFRTTSAVGDAIAAAL